MSDVITSAMFGGMLDEIKALIPVILPTVIGFMAFRKGWSFLKGEVAGA